MERPRYKKEEIRNIIEVLVSTARERKNTMDVPDAFIRQHPWSLKYLSHFAEANDFLLLAKTQDIEVCEEPISAGAKQFRLNHGMKGQIKFAVIAPANCALRTKAQRFTFEETDGGEYICMNG